MTTHRTVILIVSVVLILVLSAVVASCARDGGFIGLRNGDGSAASPINIPGVYAPATKAEEEEVNSVVDYDSFDSGDLLFNAVTVERHTLDLTTFMKSVAAELENDSRIEIVNMSVDGDLRPDGSPVSIVRFVILDPGSQIALVGRQYAVVTPDGDGFSVLTCITDDDYVDQCDDEMRTIDLGAIQ